MIAFLLIAGLSSLAFGILSLMAGGMSDNVSAGEDAGSTGCLFVLLGVIALVVALVWYLLWA